MCIGPPRYLRSSLIVMTDITVPGVNTISVIIKKLKLISSIHDNVWRLLSSCVINLIVVFVHFVARFTLLYFRKLVPRVVYFLFMNTFPNWRWFKSQKFRQISSTFCVGKILTNKEENIPAWAGGAGRLLLQPDDDLLTPCPRVRLVKVCMFTKMTNDFRNFGSQQSRGFMCHKWN